jgi:hypothetical protein
MRSFIVAALVAALGLFNVVDAQQCDLRVGYFSQTQTLYQAQQQGFFAKTGINICSAAVQGSVEAYEGLVVGRYEVLQSATDNGLSRFYLPSAYPGQDVTLLGQMDGSALQILATRWEIETVEDLRGKNVLVDSPVSGLIFNLRRKLALHNLYYPRDFNMVQAGASRFPSLRQGWYVANGVNTSIHAALITAPDSTRVIYNPDVYHGQVRNLGVIADDVAPTAGTSLQTDPHHLLNATKADNIHRFMAAMLMSRAFVRNPKNAATIKQGLMSLQSLTAAEAELSYNMGITDPIVGEMGEDFTFGRLAFGNSAFLKAIFDDRYNNSNYGEAYFNTGAGKLINYAPRDQGKIIAAQLSAVTVSNNPHTNMCIYPANKGYSYTIENAVARLQASVSGGCKNLEVSFVSCASNDAYAAPIQCTYDAASDRVTISTDLAAGQSSRQYVITYSVVDACSYDEQITQIVTVRTSNTGSCVDVRPACNVEVTSTPVSSWSTNGATISQYTVSVSNPGATAVKSVDLQISASDAARLQNVWNLAATGNNHYTLPSWSNSIAAGAQFTQAGYISSNGPINFQVASATCA